MGGELANIYISFKNLIIEREKQTEIINDINAKYLSNTEVVDTVPDVINMVAKFK